MKAGFRGWLFRGVATLAGLFGIAISLTLAEVARFYGYGALTNPAWIGLALSFLIFTAALVGMWTWKRYALVTLFTAVALGCGYLAFRPEMIRDDVLSQLATPALSVDLLVYRGIVLRDDPRREMKIQGVNFLYSFLRSYGTPPGVPPVLPNGIPSAE